MFQFLCETKDFASSLKRFCDIFRMTHSVAITFDELLKYEYEK